MDRQTDRQTDVANLIVTFLNFANAPNTALRLIVNVVIVLLGDFPASEIYVPTFRNTLSVPSSYEYGADRVFRYVGT